MILKRSIINLLLLGTTTLGLVTAVFWLSLSNIAAYASEHLDVLFLSLIGTSILTTLNMSIRWLRWHFLTRYSDLRIPTRDSIKLYFITLPAIVTPFYLGELVRAALLNRRYTNSGHIVFFIWFIERFTDVSALAALFCIAKRQWPFVAVILILWSFIVFVLIVIIKYKSMHTFPDLLILIPLFVSSFALWLLPIASLWGMLWMQGATASGWLATEAFSLGTLLGGITGVPLGTGITGSAATIYLKNHGVTLEIAAFSIAILRAGTAWYALGVGLVALFRWKNLVIALWYPWNRYDHFEEIATQYEDQLPSHIRTRLLDRKIHVMRSGLATAKIGPKACGLDIGCGPGWYACAMAKLGYQISAIDQSEGQIEQAHKHAARQNLDIDVRVGDASDMPYDDGSFDFAYAINVIHHITDLQIRTDVFQEIVRILKPGGIFFLHEINTQNLLFRTYAGYICPLICDIDEGTERWMMPTALPKVKGAVWASEINYFTFLPDFTPPLVLEKLAGLEASLERSRFRHWSAHYMACLIKDA